MTLLKVYDVIDDVIDDVIFEKKLIMTNYSVFKLKFTTDHENDSFNQIYQTNMNRKVLARLNGEAFTSEELKNINTGEGRTTLTVTDEKLIAAFTTA